MKDSAGARTANRDDVSSEEELLEREDRLARRTLRHAAREFGEEVEEALDLERRIGRHRVGALLASAAGGLLLSRPLMRLLRRPGTWSALVKPIASASVQLASANVLKNLTRSVFSDGH